MSAQIQPQITAGINPEKFSEYFFPHRKLLIVLLSVCLLIGFGLRVSNLGTESLSEDELNKLETVADYRQNGLSGRNGEHPFLMKGLQTASVSVSEKLNESVLANSPERRVSEEAALRFPTIVFGTFNALLIFLVVTELFGSSFGLIAAALWSFDPTAIGFDRIAKEDSFLLFFFLLSSFFWIKAQTHAERGTNRWEIYAWLSGAAFGGLMASKYLPHLLTVHAAYNKIFQRIPGVKWQFNRYAWLKFFIFAGIAFLILNPTILLPETWREMLLFGSENRIGHHSYEFMGELYYNKMSLWTRGVPPTFYYAFILFKTPVVTLIFCFIGMTQIFRRKMGDGRFFIFFWALAWFLPFTVLGGKFTRYFTVAEPLILISAAFGSFFVGKWLADFFISDLNAKLRNVLRWSPALILTIASLYVSIFAAPHYRLYTNVIGGGSTSAGFYFPHDEFYDSATREIVDAIIQSNPRPNAVIACETPGLFAHYIKKTSRPDLTPVLLSDPTQTANLTTGDYIAVAKGRRYFSNDIILKLLKIRLAPIAEVKFGEIRAADVFELDEATAQDIRAIKQQAEIK